MKKESKEEFGLIEEYDFNALTGQISEPKKELMDNHVPLANWSVMDFLIKKKLRILQTNYVPIF